MLCSLLSTSSHEHQINFLRMHHSKSVLKLSQVTVQLLSSANDK